MMDDLLKGREELRAAIRWRNIVILALTAILITATTVGYVQVQKSKGVIKSIKADHSKVKAHSDTAKMILIGEIAALRSALDHSYITLNDIASQETAVTENRDEKIRYISDRDLDIVIARDSIWAKISREQPWDQ